VRASRVLVAVSRRNELLKLNESENQELRKKSAPQIVDPFHFSYFLIRTSLW
jgi:hypothetical protein